MRKKAGSMVTTGILVLILILSTFSFATQAVSAREGIAARLEYCASLNSGWYQPKTWEALQKAVTTAEPYVDPAYGLDADATLRLADLNNAVVGLKRLANLDAIKATIKNLGYLNPMEFKQASWEVFLPVVAAAKSAAMNLNSSQITIDKNQNDLVIAQSKLIKIDGTTCSTVDIPDAEVKKDVLNASIYNVDYLDKSIISEVSLEIFMITYGIAKDTLVNPKATQNDVNMIQNDLVIAESFLEKDPYSAALKSIELAEFPESLRVSLYTSVDETESDSTLSEDSSPVSSSPGKSSTTVSKVKPPSSSTVDTPGQTLPAGAIIAIVIAGIAVIAGGIYAVMAGRKKTMKSNSETKGGIENESK